MDKKLIAPCGMNCALCAAHLREKDICPGCRIGPTKISCLRCHIKNCTERKNDYCYDCAKFPCERLKNLDKRYKTKYNMSEIENLKFIRDNGIEKFLKSEENKWIKNNYILCVHNKNYYNVK